MEENSWRGLVLAWANRLQLTNQPAQQMIDFTDGKFFAAFIIKHLPFWKTKGQTKTETFVELGQKGLKLAFLGQKWLVFSRFFPEQNGGYPPPLNGKFPKKNRYKMVQKRARISIFDQKYLFFADFFLAE